MILTADFWRLVCFLNIVLCNLQFHHKINAVLLVYDLNWVQQKKTGHREILQSE